MDGSPNRTPRRPGPSARGPTARTHTVFTPGCKPDSGNTHHRGTFQLRDSGSTRKASRHSRSPLLYTSPATLMPSMPRATGSPFSQPRAQSMRYQPESPCVGQRMVHVSGKVTFTHPVRGRAPSSAGAACTDTMRGAQVLANTPAGSHSIRAASHTSSRISPAIRGNVPREPRPCAMTPPIYGTHA